MIHLRELTRADMALITPWRNDPEIVRWLCAPFRFINGETDLAWFDRCQANRHTQVRCAICLNPSGRMIGLVSLTDIDWVHRSALFHIMIGDRAEHDKGYGTLATRAMVAHAFADLNLHRVWFTVLADNLRAIRVYEKTGFRKEGLLRQSLFKNGHYVSVHLMAMLADEWHAHNAD